MKRPIISAVLITVLSVVMCLKANISYAQQDGEKPKDGNDRIKLYSDAVKVIEISKMNDQSEQKKTEQKPVFACNMLALDVTARKRHIEVTKQLRAMMEQERELPDGYAFRFPSEQATILLVSEFIARERLCCPFFTLEMVVEPEDGPLWMRLRGAEGVKAFIRAEFGMK